MSSTFIYVVCVCVRERERERVWVSDSISLSEWESQSKVSKTTTGLPTLWHGGSCTVVEDTRTVQLWGSSPNSLGLTLWLFGDLQLLLIAHSKNRHPGSEPERHVCQFQTQTCLPETACNREVLQRMRQCWLVWILALNPFCSQGLNSLLSLLLGSGLLTWCFDSSPRATCAISRWLRTSQRWLNGHKTSQTHVNNDLTI